MKSAQDLRQLLSHTWYPFLGRFPQPSSIQREAIPAILRGEHVLLASPTATGKTEAYAAPLVERLLREKWASPGLLIVSPTRALANDLFRRLEPPMQKLRVPLARRTGDHADWDNDKPAAVVITTPESFDSLLSRRPQALKNVRAVVLDELHVLHGSARGDQLALLVARQERLVMHAVAGAAVAGRAVPVPLQRLAATATAGGLEDVAARYLGRGARVVHTDEQRDIQADLVRGTDAAAVLRHLRDVCKNSAVRKVLVFANSRAEAENYASACHGKAPFGADVFVHHASLSRTERERVEKRFLAAQSALCFATMTLELGIDIGDIDLVGLLGPPPDVAAMLQRVGRGNRRQWDVTRVACFYASAGQRARFEHLLHMARMGDLSGASPTFRPSVLVQQAFSLAFQNRSRWIDARSFHDRLPLWVREGYPKESLQTLLEHLADGGWLVGVGERFTPSERLERMFERGWMHSNIPDSEEADLEVVDAVTERVVGYVPENSATSEHLVLGGQKRRVQRVSAKQVRVIGAQESGAAQFRGHGSPTLSLSLAQSFSRFLGIEERRVKIVQRDGAILLAHFLGSAYGRLFMECLKRSVRGLTASGNAFVTVIAAVNVPDFHFSETDVLAEISKRRRALSAALGDGPYASKLPSGWWVGWLQETLDVPTFLSLVDTLVADHEVAPQLAEVLWSLVPRGAS